MLDTLCVVITLLFFAVALGFVRGCAALEKEES